MSKTPRAEKDLELLPDAWARFERAADVVVKSPPQHREKPKRKKRKNTKAKKPGK